VAIRIIWSDIQD
nr:RecName: Full=Venom peptide 7; AltName: Full=BaP-7 [Brotheas amazonicus]